MQWNVERWATFLNGKENSAEDQKKLDKLMHTLMKPLNFALKKVTVGLLHAVTPMICTEESMQTIQQELKEEQTSKLESLQADDPEKKKQIVEEYKKQKMLVANFCPAMALVKVVGFNHIGGLLFTTDYDYVNQLPRSGELYKVPRGKITKSLGTIGNYLPKISWVKEGAIATQCLPEVTKDQKSVKSVCIPLDQY